jgi:hypothetical protein
MVVDCHLKRSGSHHSTNKEDEMHKSPTVTHRPMSGKLGQFMIMEMTPPKDKKEDKVKDSKQPARGTFGWDNVDVVV